MPHLSQQDAPTPDDLERALIETAGNPDTLEAVSALGKCIQQVLPRRLAASTHPDTGWFTEGKWRWQVCDARDELINAHLRLHGTEDQEGSDPTQEGMVNCPLCGGRYRTATQKFCGDCGSARTSATSGMVL